MLTLFINTVLLVTAKQYLDVWSTEIGMDFLNDCLCFHGKRLSVVLISHETASKQIKKITETRSTFHIASFKSIAVARCFRIIRTSRRITALTPARQKKPILLLY